MDLSKFDKAAADAGKTQDGQFAVTAGMNALVVLANPVAGLRQRRDPAG